MKNSRKYLAAPYVIWAIGFIILPLTFIVYYAMTNRSGEFTWSNVVAMVTNPIYRKALILSLTVALSTTVICLLLAYPLALILRYLNFSKMSIIMVVVILPMWMNFVLRVIAWQVILARNGILNMLLTSIGLSPLEIINTPVAIAIGMIYDFLPYMILPLYNSVMSIPNELIEASNDLGAGPVKTFRNVILPLSAPGIISGVTMVFIPSMTSFAVADILGGKKTQLLGNVIERAFLGDMNWNSGSGLALTLMAFALLGALFTRQDDGKEGSSIW